VRVLLKHNFELLRALIFQLTATNIVERNVKHLELVVFIQGLSDTDPALEAYPVPVD
jgi:hypothetical protein